MHDYDHVGHQLPATRAVTEPDSVRLIRALRALDEEREARKRAEKRAGTLATKLAKLTGKPLEPERHLSCRATRQATARWRRPALRRPMSSMPRPTISWNATVSGSALYPSL